MVGKMVDYLDNLTVGLLVVGLVSQMVEMMGILKVGWMDH